MDGLSKKLTNSGLGCHIASMFTGAFSYADDLKLLTASYGLCIKCLIYVKGMHRNLMLYLSNYLQGV